MSKEVKRVNMNGSDDPYYRYTMPCIAIKVEGTTKMIKTVLVNIDDVCRAIGRPPDYLLTFLGQELSANSKIEKETEKAYVTGAMEEKQIQALIFKFIQETVQCGNCKGPETTVHIEGSKKNKTLFLTCKGCGSRTDLDSNERFVKYMILHPPTDANYGHAKTAAGAVGSAMAEATALDEAAKKKKKNKGEDAEDDDAEKKEKKKKKKKDKDAEDEEDSPDGEDKKEKKKKKKKDKDADEEEGEEGEDKKEKKKKKKKDKEKKKDGDGGDSWDDDWGEDTSPEAVAARQANLGSGATEDKLEKKMEAVKVAQKNDDDSDDDDGPAAGATAAKPEEEDDDDLDIDDI